MGRGELPGLFGFYSSSAVWRSKTYGLNPQSPKIFSCLTRAESDAKNADHTRADAGEDKISLGGLSENTIAPTLRPQRMFLKSCAA
jgi:hypothetical protein